MRGLRENMAGEEMTNIEKEILNLKCSGNEADYQVGALLELMMERIKRLEELLETKADRPRRTNKLPYDLSSR